jgi:uncharacterized membrane protein
MWRRSRRLGLWVDVGRIERAIAEAEKQSTAEVRVSVSRFFWGDVRHHAERAFRRLGMRNTEHRNGVLIFLVPSRRTLVVLGDEGIHEKVGQAFWDDVVRKASARFSAGDYTEGLLEAIATVGKPLAEHFPSEGVNPNELPNQVDFGPGVSPPM